VGAAITVVFSLWLVPRFGLWGAVWAAVACYAVMAVLMTRTSQKLYRIDLDWPRLLPLFVWFLLTFAAGSWVQAHPETGYAFRFALLFIGLLLPFVLGAVRKDEIEVMKTLMRRR
jgi:O-antigen/teichoic acid export membrane protein